MNLIQLVFLVASAFLALAVQAQEVKVTSDKPNGLCQPNEPVTWTLSTTTAQPKPLSYMVLSDGRTTNRTGMLEFTNGRATVTATLDKPGTLLFKASDSGNSNYDGVAVNWPAIKPSQPEPPDFDAFWKEKLAELAAVPADPQLEEVNSGATNVRLWKITMNNIRGTHIYGYLARPKEDAPCPAMLQVQAAGIYPLTKEWVVGSAKGGWLTLSISAHDLPVDQPLAFYKEMDQGALKHYASQGASDRNQSYFLRMFLACYRAVDYLTNRPDWNQKAMLVQGGSQGGFQTLATAGLHPAVTMATAHLPAGCDHTGPLIGRAPGWPNWLLDSKGAEREARAQASGYYDSINFAARVRCPILIGVGLIDVTCPPAGVFAMFNRINAPKRIVIMPKVSHESGQSAPYFSTRAQWWEAAKDGKLPPLE